MAYGARMQCAAACDILLSATTSPHYTVARDDLAQLAQVPPIVCDLSMPRDIEPAVREMDEVEVFLDMDSMGGRDVHVNEIGRAHV